MSETIKLSDFPLQSSLADDDTIILNGKRITAANLLAAVRDSIKVGGRNLLKNTSNFKINTSGMTWLSGRLTVSQNSLLSYEDVVTLSARYKKIASGSASGSFQLGAIVSPSWYEQTTFNSSELADEGIVSKSFRMSRYREEWDSFSLFVNGNPDYEIYDLKLERGNIPTDWSPAPEDLSGG